MILLRLRSAALSCCLDPRRHHGRPGRRRSRASPQTFNTPGYTPPAATRVPGAAGQAAPGAATPRRCSAGARPPTSRGSLGDRQDGMGERRTARAAHAAGQAERVPEVRRGRHRPPAAGVRRRLLRRQPADSLAPVDNVPVSADYTVGPGDEMMIRAWGSIDVDYRSNGRPQRPAQPAQGRQLQRRRREGRGARAAPARADRPPLHQLQPERDARPAARASRCSSSARRSARASTRCRASRPCCRRWSPRAGRAPNGSMRKVTLRRDGQRRLRARHLRLPRAGRQVQGPAAARRRRGRVPAGRAAGRADRRASTRRRSTS